MESASWKNLYTFKRWVDILNSFKVLNRQLFYDLLKALKLTTLIGIFNVFWVWKSKMSLMTASVLVKSDSHLTRTTQLFREKFFLCEKLITVVRFACVKIDQDNLFYWGEHEPLCYCSFIENIQNFGGETPKL